MGGGGGGGGSVGKNKAKTKTSRCDLKNGFILKSKTHQTVMRAEGVKALIFANDNDLFDRVSRPIHGRSVCSVIKCACSECGHLRVPNCSSYSQIGVLISG